MSQLLTISELADELSVKSSWIRSMVFHKKIPFLKLGRHIRFDKDVIEKWIADNNRTERWGTNG